MELDMVADMEVDKVPDMVADNKRHGYWIFNLVRELVTPKPKLKPKLFRPKA